MLYKVCFKGSVNGFSGSKVLGFAVCGLEFSTRTYS